jgi:hypothetical protein
MALFTSTPDRRVLNDHEVVSSWGLTVPFGAGHTEKFFQVLEQQLALYDLPQTTVKRQELDYWGKNGKKEISFQEIVYVECGAFKSYFVFQEVGKHLILSHLNSGSQTRGDLFTYKAINAYFNLIAAARDNAVEHFVKELKLDISKINPEEKSMIDIT